MGRFDEEDHEDTSDREVSAALTVGEGDVDASLRPRSLGEFIGQPRVREQLQLVNLAASAAECGGKRLDHYWLNGGAHLRLRRVQRNLLRVHLNRFTRRTAAQREVSRRGYGNFDVDVILDRPLEPGLFHRDREIVPQNDGFIRHHGPPVRQGLQTGGRFQIVGDRVGRPSNLDRIRTRGRHAQRRRFHGDQIRRQGRYRSRRL